MEKVIPPLKYISQIIWANCPLILFFPFLWSLDKVGNMDNQLRLRLRF